MRDGLKRDICHLKYPGALTCDVTQDYMAKSIPPKLRYACKCWVEILQRSRVKLEDDEQLLDLIYKFLRDCFLYWLEALSLMCSLSDGLAALTILDDLVVVTVLDQNIVR